VANINRPRFAFTRTLSTIGPILAVFVVAMCVLFGIFYGLIKAYLNHGVNERLTRATAQMVKRTPEEARRDIDERSKRDVSNVRPYGLFDASGQPITGNIPALPPHVVDWKPFQYDRWVMDHNGWEYLHIRALAATYANGERVVVGQGIDDMLRFDVLLIRVALLGLVSTIVVGVSCGFALNAVSNRRIRVIRESCQEIVISDFERRLPVRGTHDDVDRLVVIVNSMLDDIQRLVHELRGVCAWIAHDLRTPMTSLRAGLERAQRNAVQPQEYQQAVVQAIVQSDRVLNRFSALLRIAEIEAHAQRANFRLIDLGEILLDVAELYEPLAEERGVQLIVEAQGEAPILGDRDLIFGAIENLLDNALKFTPGGGTVTMRLVQLEQASMVEVADTGPGIPPPEREAVLRPFYRSAQISGMPQPGHGLGLSLVAATARLHGADLSIEEGKPGCRVQMRFAART